MVSGVGPTGFPGVDFPIPADARSLVLTFECAGGGDFTVELGDSMMLGQSPLSGICVGETELAWPIGDKTAPTLGVTVAEGIEWMATPTFSSEEFSFDAALKAECEQFSDVYSALMNADTGYTQYGAFDAAEWTSRVDRASTQLGALATASSSPLGGAYAQLRAVVDDPERSVGAALTAEAQSPIGEISEACGANQTPLILKAEFGG